jgi:hypothetical protein
MKNIIQFLVLILILSAGCSKWVDPDINKDPNNPTDVAEPQLIAPVEVNLAYIVGGELARWNCVWMQQIAGIQSQSAENDIYTISEADVTNAWSWNLYSPGMINTKIIMKKAAEGGSPHYAGVAKILMAYHLGVTTDLWGDIPYTEALSGLQNNFKPKYDTQAQIYDTIFSLLTQAISDLSEPNSVLSPGDEDLIYRGDLDKWTKTAYALRARYNLHLAKRNGNSAYTAALAAIANSYTGNDDDFVLVFGTATSNSNPIYQSEQRRSGYYTASATLQEKLTLAGDPRQAVYFSGTTGSKPGEPDPDASTIGTAFASVNSPVYLMSYTELKFIESEAAFKTGDLVRAASAYNEGLKASLLREGVYGDGTWYNTHKETDASVSLEKIMTQKWMSAFLQIETWTDWRRTGFPVLPLATGAVINQIPRRLPYPDDERLYNGANMPSGLTITDRVWWDVAK